MRSIASHQECVLSFGVHDCLLSAGASLTKKYATPEMLRIFNPTGWLLLACHEGYGYSAWTRMGTKGCAQLILRNLARINRFEGFS